MAFDIQTWAQIAAFTGGGLAMGLGAIGAAVGEGHTAACANTAISRRPESAGDIIKTMLVGQAIAESAAIFALVVAMLLLFRNVPAESLITVSVILGAGLSIGFAAIGSGIGAGFPAGAACIGTADQPAVSSRLTTNMLIGSAVCQTPAVFGLVISFILLFTSFAGRPLSPSWAALLGAGFAAGIGSIGAGVGSGLVAESGCEGIARQPLAGSAVTNVMLLGQAVAQTTAIYGLLVSFILIFKVSDPADTIAPSMALLGAGLCMGIGAIGPGIGIGLTGRSAVRWVARNENSIAVIVRSMLIGSAVVESTSIYAMVVSLVLIFVM